MSRRRPSFQSGYVGYQRRHLSDAPEQWLGDVASYAPFLGVQGNTLYDLSGFARHGTLTNMVMASAWTVGQRGTALKFDGVTNYVDFRPPHESLNLYSGTLIAWIKTPGAGTGYRGIVVKQSAYGMFLSSGVLITYDWGGGGGERSTGVNLADDRWHMVAVAFNSGVSNITMVYSDAIPVLQTSITVQDQASAMAIAAGDQAGTLQHFAGLIDDIRVYNRILSAGEIAAIKADSDARYRLQPRMWAMSFDAIDVSQFRRRPPR